MLFFNLIVKYIWKSAINVKNVISSPIKYWNQLEVSQTEYGFTTNQSEILICSKLATSVTNLNVLICFKGE